MSLNDSVALSSGAPLTGSVWQVTQKLQSITHYTLLSEKKKDLLNLLLSNQSNGLHYLLLYFCYSALGFIKGALKLLEIPHNHKLNLEMVKTTPWLNKQAPLQYGEIIRPISNLLSLTECT